MRRVILSLLALTLVGLLVLLPAPSAEADTGCVITVAGVKVCGELLGEPLPEVITVTVKPDPIIIPGPTSTSTVTPPPVTVTVPGPPGPTQTVTETSQPETVTATPDAVPDETVTETTTVSPSETGQDPVDDGTLGDNEPDDTSDIDFGDGDITIEEAGIGILTLLALVGLLLLSMYAGYVLGYKDKEAKDTRFMRALLDTVKSR